MKVLAGIVTYEADLPRLEKCIEAVVAQTQEVVIVDNGSSNLDGIKLLAKNGVTIIENEKNEGIAHALNQIFQYATDNEYEWVLTLDQDTVIPNGMLSEYQRVVDDLDDKQIAVICPQVHDIQTDHIWPVVTEERKWVDVERCITSGSLNSVDAWKKIGGFDEYLFIDEVDHDFCFRLKKEGFRILLVSGVNIDHQIGNTHIVRFLGKNIYIRNHSAFRKYYMVRNMIYISKKQYGYVRASAVIHATAFIVKTLVFEQKRKEKLLACIRGFRDGMRRGKY